jgi:uncharacterized protein (DUF1800 family)
MKFKALRSFSYFLLSLFLLLHFVLQPVAFAQGAPKRTVVLTNDQKIRQVLSRLTFGARPGDVERIRKTGIKAFIDQQLSPGTIDDSATDKMIAKLYTLRLTTPAILEQYISPKPAPSPSPVAKTGPIFTPRAPKSTSFPPEAALGSLGMEPELSRPAPPVMSLQPNKPQQIVTELQRAKLLRAVYSERQLFEVVVDFWENHFNIFVGKNADRWLMTSFDRESVRPYVLGRFRDLLGSVARSPAMLYYLDNWQSSVARNYPATKDRPARQTGGINENYARELLELHTLGVNGGYTQQDVQEVARCFTGWTIRKPDQEGTFLYDPSKHDDGEKTVLGRKIPAGGGIADAEMVLDILAKHPSTARFIAEKLARRFLGDDPPAVAIDEAARVYLKTDGSIRDTLRSLITSPYFFSPALYQSKVRTPFEFSVAALRMTGAKTDANRPLLDWVARMGQPVFGSRTPDGYPEDGTEFLSNSSILHRLNFTAALLTDQIKGTTADQKLLLKTANLNDPVDVAAVLLRVVLMNEPKPGTRRVLYKTAEDSSSRLKLKNASASFPLQGTAKPANAAEKRAAADKTEDPVTALIILALGTPEFQRK